MKNGIKYKTAKKNTKLFEFIEEEKETGKLSKDKKPRDLNAGMPKKIQPSEN